MMIDEDGDGAVDFDEAAKMFRNRYGEPTNRLSCLQPINTATSFLNCTVRMLVLAFSGREAVDRVQTMFKQRAGKPSLNASFVLSLRFSRDLYVRRNTCVIACAWIANLCD